jgi:hypothetical protein
MAEQNAEEQNKRRFIRIDLTDDVRAIDASGQEIGRVEKVGAGGMQIRISQSSARRDYPLGSHMAIKVVEPGNVQQQFNVEVRVCDGDLLGVQFLN